MTRIISISTGAFDGYDLPTALDEIAALEVSHVELAFIEGYTEPFEESYFNPDNSVSIRSLMEDRGLKCLAFSSHINLGADDAIPIFTGRMEFASSLGAKIIITNAAPRDQERVFIKNIDILAGLAEEKGLVIALENPGDGKDNVFNTGSDGAELITRIGSEAVRLNYDFGNLVSHCFDTVEPETDYLAAAPFTAHYHLKDVAHNGDGWGFTEIGQGRIDYRRILREVSALSGQTPVSLEIPLRIVRGADARPRRAAEPIDLPTIRMILKNSLMFVRAGLDG